MIKQSGDQKMFGEKERGESGRERRGGEGEGEMLS